MLMPEVIPLMSYQRKQYGSLVFALILVAAAFAVGLTLADQDGDVYFVLRLVSVVIALIALFFISLTVSVDEQCVKLSFGIGLISRRIPLERIESASPVRNSWWYGLGIRLTPHGWMWNVHGLDAVELTYTGGRRFRIGTADPQGLSTAIDAACAELGRS